MREIKFRGQCQATNEWVFGLPSTMTTLSNSISHIAQFAGPDRKFGRENIMIIPETVGQYTGLKDKKETEIYDGDLLKGHNGKVYVILWDHGDARFVSVDLEDYKLDSESRFDEQNLIWVDCEVIGNIHSNPELLK